MTHRIRRFMMYHLYLKEILLINPMHSKFMMILLTSSTSLRGMPSRWRHSLVRPSWPPPSLCRPVILGLNPNYILSQEDQKIGRMAKTSFFFQQGLYKLSQLNWMVDGDNDSKDYAIFDKDGQRLCNFKLAISVRWKILSNLSVERWWAFYCLIATLVDQDSLCSRSLSTKIRIWKHLKEKSHLQKAKGSGDGFFVYLKCWRLASCHSLEKAWSSFHYFRGQAQL